jgi:hypothetical protein
MDQPDADGIGIGGLSVPESATPPPRVGARLTRRWLRVLGDGFFERNPGIVMPVTLHDRALNTY